MTLKYFLKKIPFIKGNKTKVSYIVKTIVGSAILICQINVRAFYKTDFSFYFLTPESFCEYDKNACLRAT